MKPSKKPMPSTPSITTKWRKIMLVGCSHGLHLSADARNAVLHFRDHFQPDDVWHLGDYLDTTAFRAGAQGTADEAEDIPPDLMTGLLFLEELGATYAFDGNHEHRIYSKLNHPNALIRYAAEQVANIIEQHFKKAHITRVPYHIQRGWRPFGNFVAGHGYMYNEQACRDHAEAFGNVVFAHTHKTGLAKGRRLDNPTGICVGTLADIPNMDYATTRRATLSWNPGICWGYYNDTKTQLWLHEQNSGDNNWLLPI